MRELMFVVSGVCSLPGSLLGVVGLASQIGERGDTGRYLCRLEHEASLADN